MEWYKTTIYIQVQILANGLKKITFDDINALSSRQII